MPDLHKDEEPVSGSRAKQVDPVKYVFASRRWLLLLVMYTLGLPVFFAILVPPAVGGWILWHQYALYREEGRWHEFSMYGLATLTLDEALASGLGWPSLAACNAYESPPGAAAAECPQLGPWQSWLLHPNAYPEWHARAEALFQSVPVSSVFFLIGLILSFVLQFFGIDWRFRSRPPPPVPAASSAAIRELTPGRQPSQDSDKSG